MFSQLPSQKLVLAVAQANISWLRRIDHSFTGAPTRQTTCSHTYSLRCRPVCCANFCQCYTWLQIYHCPWHSCNSIKRVQLCRPSSTPIPWHRVNPETFLLLVLQKNTAHSFRHNFRAALSDFYANPDFCIRFRRGLMLPLQLSGPSFC
jgi:hypothetical protein